MTCADGRASGCVRQRAAVSTDGRRAHLKPCAAHSMPWPTSRLPMSSIGCGPRKTPNTAPAEGWVGGGSLISAGAALCRRSIGAGMALMLRAVGHKVLAANDESCKQGSQMAQSRRSVLSGGWHSRRVIAAEVAQPPTPPKTTAHHQPLSIHTSPPVSSGLGFTPMYEVRFSLSRPGVMAARSGGGRACV